MSRGIQVTVPPEQTEQLLEALMQIDSIISLSLQTGASLKPPGDVIALQVTSGGLEEVLGLLEERGILSGTGATTTTSEPASIISTTFADSLLTESSEASWEEIATSVTRESHITLNKALLMAISGLLAAVGLASNSLHVVIAAMVLAPGFEPIVRIGLGVVGSSRRNLRIGLRDTGIAYLAMLGGAAVAALVLDLRGTDVLGRNSDGYLEPNSLVNYWSTLTLPAFLTSVVAAIAGALVVALNRSVLTIGAMVGLALVPSVALVMLGAVAGDGELMARGGGRWALDVVLVGAASLIIFGWTPRRKARRPSAL